VGVTLISFVRLSLLAALFFTFAAAAPSPRAAVRPPKIGEQPPAFTLRGQNGKKVSLADAAGTKVVLVFYRGYW
jgi:cytochrome oxidase Cu insertion factor (SCO1/SenC/PrrC family)